MNWQDMGIRKKFFYGFGVVIVITLVMVFVDLYRAHQLNELYNKREQTHSLLFDLKKAELSHLDWRHSLRNAIDYKNKAILDNLQIDYKLCDFGKWYYSKKREDLAKEIPMLVTILIEIEDKHKRLHESAAKIKTLVNEDSKDGFNKARQIMFSETIPLTNQIREGLNKINPFIEKRISELDSEINVKGRYYLIFGIFVSFLSIFLIVFVSIKLTNHITTNINKAVGVARKLSDGDVDINIEVTHKDETGELMKAMLKLAQYMQDIAQSSQKIAKGDLTINLKLLSEKDVLGKSLKDMLTNLRQQTQEILEIVSILATSINQIMTSTSEIAASVSETASSVGETTVTSNEVRQTAKLVSSKANYVSDVTRKVVESAQIAYASVDETLDNINSIKQKMETITDSIIKLSEQSQMIGEIINTVSDIAEQTNLLAVNAAIEAARAGEHGRGFAVVAQEIRSLAEQSKTSTHQIRTILNDIQRATSKAVLVTEQGAKVVDESIRQSTDTGTNIRALANNISEVADAGSQILASSQQQTAGMDQIVLAMESINQAIIQNTEGIKMVELTTKNIKDIIQRLKVITDKYKV
ncbi:MAG: methyl-accepting chemotaxis protein [Thermodesulfovibrionales bacterium]|nr:methyl-accepting chemotaxis protein [Thermodesulfovibrionales bacterium]